MAITNQDLANLVAGLAQNQNSLQQSLQTLVDNLTSSKKAGKPHEYTGVRGEDARRFMAALELYFNNHSRLSTANVTDKIVATIPFLTGEAAIWATPISEKINDGTGHGYADWDAFKDAFKKRFETASAQEDAKASLKALRQGKHSVAYYASMFKQYSDRTGWGAVDLRDRFYDHLAPRIKDALVNSDRPTGTFAELEKVATDIDLRQIQRAKEEGRQLVVDNPTNIEHKETPSYFTPTRDPNAMDIDATSTGPRRTDEEYRQMMRGRCYGCGSRNHRKADGHHERDVCRYCGLTGHLENVCRRKFLGLGKKTVQRVAATDSVVSTNATPTPAVSTSTAPPADVTNILQQLITNQQALATSIAALQSNF